MSSATFNYNSSKLSRVISRALEDYDEDPYDSFYQLQVAQPYNDDTTKYNNNEGSNDVSHDVMPSETTSHQEAYYLYFIATVGIILNCVVVMAIFIRKPMRKMTSGFLIHACFLDILKSAYCIPIGSNLLSQTKPSDCDFFGATFVIIVTTSVFNMVATVCTEAYTFGEANVGGNSKGTLICVVFGIALVYVGSIILHLGPTLIGGHFEFQPEIGSCSFILGKQTGYVANVMWIVITTIAILAVIHFINKLYKEIQINQPNRVSFLVRTSITVMDSATRSTCNLRKIIKDAIHRSKIFILNTVFFVVCWYPFFLLILIDKNFKVSPKIYQTFAFIAWSQGAIQPILYICFDRHLDLLARHCSCDKYNYDIDTIAQLMMNRRRNTDQSEARFSNPDMELTSPSAPMRESYGTATEIRGEASVDIIREHQNMCVVQNSSNQNADFSEMNFSAGRNNEHFHLSNQLPRISSTSTNENAEISNSNLTDDRTLPLRRGSLGSLEYYEDNDNYSENSENSIELQC